MNKVGNPERKRIQTSFNQLLWTLIAAVGVAYQTIPRRVEFIDR